ncbi:MAG: O-antigen ligase family protein [Anaerolineae bacterium]|nr:O-antigen ligase family protein [Anaerolineae bacterium]MCB0212259.1 O-antigen ligase family protein [Anaerolineae bacterium]
MEAFITKSFKPLFLKLNPLRMSLLTIALGVSFGYIITLSDESAWLLLSIVVIVVALIISIKKPFYGFVLLIFLYSFIEAYIEIPMGAGIPDLSFSRFLFGFLFILMLAQAAIGKFKFAPIGITEIFLFGTILGIGSSASLAGNPIRMLQLLFSGFFMPLGMYYLAKCLIQNKSELHILFYTVVLVSFVSAVYAVYESSTGHVLFLSGTQSVEELDTNYGGGLWQLNGIFGSPTIFGRLFAMAIPLTFYLFFEEKPANKKTLLGLVIAVQFYALFITYNRSSWYAALIGLTILQFFYKQFRFIYIVLVFVSALALWATWDQVSESTVVENRVNKRTEDFNGRSEMWITAQKMWEKKPIRGWGQGAFRTESGRFRTDGSGRNFISTQSEYWNLLVHYGLIGFVPYVGFLLIPLISSFVLFYLTHQPGWSGFIKAETIAVYWTVILCYFLGGYTVPVVHPIGRIIPFVIVGAVVGTHQHLAWNRNLLRDSISESKTELATR